MLICANTMEAATDDGLWMQLIVIESPNHGGGNRCNDMRILDQLEGSEAVSVRPMLVLLGDLRR